MPGDYETTEFERPVADRVLEPEVLTAFARETWRGRDAGCTRCPLHAGARTVCLFGNGTRRRSGLAIVADHPTEHDDRWGPFSTVDVRWAYLATMLRDLDLDLSEVYRTYAVRCAPVEAEQVTRPTVHACQPYLLRELWQVRPSAVLTLGAGAYYALTRGTGITKKRGQAVRWSLPCACEGECCGGAGTTASLDEAGVTVHTRCACGGVCGYASGGHEAWLVPTVSPGAVLQRPAMHATFFADLAKWRRLGFGEDTTPEVEIVEVRSLEGLRSALDELRATHRRVLTFDLETRGLVDHRDDYAKVWCAALSTGHRGERGTRVFLVPLEHPESPWFPEGPVPARWRSYPEVRPAVEMLAGLLTERSLNGHNVKFDVRHWRDLARRYDLGGEYRIGFDTILAAHTLDETRDMNLLDQASTALGVNDWGKGVQQFGLAEVDDLRELLDLRGKQGLGPLWGEEGLGFYCARDVAYCHLLYEQQRLKLREEPSAARLYRDLVLPGVNAFVDVELNGLWVDRERLAAADAELARQHAEARATLIREHVDPELFAEWEERAKRGKKDVLANDHFLRAWLYSEKPRGLGFEPVNFTKTKLPQVDEKTLRLYQHPALDVLHEMRKAAKFRSFFEQWREGLGDDGRLHASFNLTGTVTGRRSCSNPNLQQVPRDRLVRSVIGAPPGHVFLEVDYSQLEVRLAAWLFAESNMLEVFRRGGDIYREAAARVLGKRPEEVTSDQRQAAKVQVLGFIYGLSAPGFVLYAKSLYDLDFTLDEAAAVRDAFFAAFPGLVYGHERARQEARRRWQVQAPDGRTRHLINILSLNGRERGKAERQAINSPVQGLGGDFTLSAVVELRERFRHLEPGRVRVVGDVHDALLFELRRDTWREDAETILRVMERPRVMHDLTGGWPVKLVAEGKVGTHWKDERAVEFTLAGTEKLPALRDVVLPEDGR